MYNLPALYKKDITGKGTTIAIVDNFGSPTIKNDLGVFDRAFGLPGSAVVHHHRASGEDPGLRPQERPVK